MSTGTARWSRSSGTCRAGRLGGFAAGLGFLTPGTLLVLLAAGAAHAQPAPVAPAEIRDQWTGRTLAGRTPTGAAVAMTFGADGKATLSGAASDAGTWRVSDDGYCTTWLRIRHGYPLDGAWGQAVYPKKKDEENVERIKLISQENAQLRAELGSVKDRLANVERIVTDGSSQLANEIEALRRLSN